MKSLFNDFPLLIFFSTIFYGSYHLLGISDTQYETLISRLMKNQPLQDETERKMSDTEIRRRSSDNQEAPQPTSIMVSKLKVNVSSLQQVWDAGQRSTKEDWIEWMRRFSVGLLRETPSTALRSCMALAQDYSPLVKELFNAAFVSEMSRIFERVKQRQKNENEAIFIH